MQKISLRNNIELVYKNTKNTPRVALSIYISIDKQEKYAGIYSLMNRLFLQGTKTRTSAQLAKILDENAIECYSVYKADNIRFQLLCLNEDFKLGLEILKDIILNTTFEEFEKEKTKLRGEIEADLDTPKALAVDAFYRNLYKDKIYGNTGSKILEDLDKITKEDVINAYNQILNSSRKVMTLVGDIEFENIKGYIEESFIDLKNAEYIEEEEKGDSLEKFELIKVEKEEVSQAQILWGWYAPRLKSEEYGSMLVLNTILGACGLSSRLFTELRDKKGLAYVVRSNYETYRKSANINVYIATDPKNINTSIEGFVYELNRLKQEFVSEKELENAKNNILGKRKFYLETNLQQASLYSYYLLENLGLDFETKIKELVLKVTKEDIKEIANKYFIGNRSILTILGPKEELDKIDPSNIKL